jgi:hypothetical protein
LEQQKNPLEVHEIIGGLCQVAQRRMIHAQDGRLVQFWANECPTRADDLRGTMISRHRSGGIIII